MAVSGGRFLYSTDTFTKAVVNIYTPPSYIVFIKTSFKGLAPT